MANILRLSGSKKVDINKEAQLEVKSSRSTTNWNPGYGFYAKAWAMMAGDSANVGNTNVINLYTGENYTGTVKKITFKQWLPGFGASVIDDDTVYKSAKFTSDGGATGYALFYTRVDETGGGVLKFLIQAIKTLLSYKERSCY